jgi:hypothetical protein
MGPIPDRREPNFAQKRIRHGFAGIGRDDAIMSAIAFHVRNDWKLKTEHENINESNV